MHTFKSNFFASTSNVPVHFVVVLNRWPSTKRFQFTFLMEKPHFYMKVSKVGCHKKALVVLWGHTELFGEVKFMVVA